MATKRVHIEDFHQAASESEFLMVAHANLYLLLDTDSFGLAHKILALIACMQISVTNTHAVVSSWVPVLYLAIVGKGPLPKLGKCD